MTLQMWVSMVFQQVIKNPKIYNEILSCVNFSKITCSSPVSKYLSNPLNYLRRAFNHIDITESSTSPAVVVKVLPMIFTKDSSHKWIRAWNGSRIKESLLSTTIDLLWIEYKYVHTKRVWQVTEFGLLCEL